jgi:hypothetical protein
MAGYESITTAPDPRTAVFRSRGDRLASPTHDGQPPRPAPITQTAKPVARSPTICGVTYLAGKGAGLVHVPGTVRVVRVGLRARAGNQTVLDRVQPGEETGPARHIDRATAPCGHWPTCWCMCAVGRLLWPLTPSRDP